MSDLWFWYYCYDCNTEWEARVNDESMDGRECSYCCGGNTEFIRWSDDDKCEM